MKTFNKQQILETTGDGDVFSAIFNKSHMFDHMAVDPYDNFFDYFREINFSEAAETLNKGGEIVRSTNGYMVGSGKAVYHWYVQR